MIVVIALPLCGLIPYHVAVPMESRIATERGRRVVVAWLMAGVLVGALALAWWQSGGGWIPGIGLGGAGLMEVELTGERVGPFTFGRPAGWQEMAIEPDGRAITGSGIIFTESGDGGRELLAMRLAFVRPAPPQAAAERFFEQIADGPAQVWALGPGRRGALATLTGVVVTAQGERLLAVVTVDGQEYLGLSLSADRMGPEEAALMEWVVASVRDERFVSLGDRLALPVGMTIEAPPGLSALGEAGAAGNGERGSVLFHPAHDPRFGVMRLSLIDLAESPQPPGLPAVSGGTGARTAEELERYEVLTQLIVDYERGTAAQRLLTHLLVGYDRATGRLPPGAAYGQFRVLDESGYLLVLRSSPRLGIYEAVWGVTLGPEQGARIEVAAALDADDRGNDAAEPMQQAASVLIQTLIGSRERPEVPDRKVETEIAD